MIKLGSGLIPPPGYERTELVSMGTGQEKVFRSATGSPSTPWHLVEKSAAIAQVDANTPTNIEIQALVITSPSREEHICQSWEARSADAPSFDTRNVDRSDDR